MSHYLAPLVAASATWLDRAYGGGDASPVLAALAQVQARQAVTVAAWLRYPTGMDSALVHLTGPGGPGRLQAGSGLAPAPREPWHTWVDEAVVSWAACLLGDAELARVAVRAAARTEHAEGLVLHFRSLLSPDVTEIRAGVLLRHPGVIDAVAQLHRAALRRRLGVASDNP